jgi:hypothetical protein
MVAELLSKTPHSTEAVVMLLVVLIGGGIAFTAIVAGLLRSYAVARMEIALKRDMVERGMSAEAIARVINTHSTPSEDAVPLSWPSQVVVQSDGDWHDALVLKAAEGRYYVHFVGTEMDENQWVEQDCVRFPAGSNIPNLVAHAGCVTPNGAPAKEPMMEEV